MAIPSKIFYLYKARRDSKDYFFIIRTSKPAYSNADEGASDYAYTIEDEKHQQILTAISKEQNLEQGSLILLGESWDFRHGDVFDAILGSKTVKIQVAHSAEHKGSIFFALAKDEQECKDLLEEYRDEDFIPFGKLQNIQEYTVDFFTEEEFGLKDHSKVHLNYPS